MSMLSPDYEPELSDLRTRTSANPGVPTVSALAQQNASRVSRHQELRLWESPRRSLSARQRRIASIIRDGFRHRSPPPPIQQANKRLRLERNGQREVEHLPMELRHCDGGRFDSSGPVYGMPDYRPENALRDDSTVYCTNEPQCTMILQHQNGQCFSLERLVIRAPPDSYTSPYASQLHSSSGAEHRRVRAGMVFVVMDDTDLLSKTNHPAFFEQQGDPYDTDDDEHSPDFRLLDRDPCDNPDDLGSEEHRPFGMFPPAPVLRGASSLSGRPIVLPSPPTLSSSSLWANLDDPVSRNPPIDLIEPNATFHLKDERTMCVLEFDPPLYNSSPSFTPISSLIDTAKLRQVFAIEILFDPSTEEY